MDSTICHMWFMLTLVIEATILSANWLIPEEEQTSLMLTFQRDRFHFFEKDIPASES